MTNQEILRIAQAQSARDLHCEPEDLCSRQNKVVLSQPHPGARRYLELPFFCNLVSYGSNIVASVDERIQDFVSEYINKLPIAHRFETPGLHRLDEECLKYGKRVCYMAEYFLPDVAKLRLHTCEYPVRILHPGDFAGYYTDTWANALCQKRKQLDMLAAAAFDGDQMIGMAGASADCESMWQIGIDVLPEYRRKGIAAALTSRLSHELLKRGKVPFYCAAWSNLASVRNALHCGFYPAWVELTAIDAKKMESL